MLTVERFRRRTDQAREELRISIHNLIQELQELDAALEPVACVHKFENGRCLLCGGGTPRYPYPGSLVNQAVFHAIEGGAHSPKEIEATTKLNRSQIYNAVHMLVGQKKLKRAKEGQYQLA